MLHSSAVLGLIGAVKALADPSELLLGSGCVQQQLWTGLTSVILFNVGVMDQYLVFNHFSIISPSSQPSGSLRSCRPPTVAAVLSSRGLVTFSSMFLSQFVFNFIAYWTWKWRALTFHTLKCTLIHIEQWRGTPCSKTNGDTSGMLPYIIQVLTQW